MTEYRKFGDEKIRRTHRKRKAFVIVQGRKLKSILWILVFYIFIQIQRSFLVVVFPAFPNTRALTASEKKRKIAPKRYRNTFMISKGNM